MAVTSVTLSNKFRLRPSNVGDDVEVDITVVSLGFGASDKNIL